VKDTVQKIFPDDIPQEAYGAMLRNMKTNGWKLTSTSFHNIVLTFEREVPDSPANNYVELDDAGNPILKPGDIRLGPKKEIERLIRTLSANCESDDEVVSGDRKTFGNPFALLNLPARSADKIELGMDLPIFGESDLPPGLDLDGDSKPI
jgi:regulatory protein YycH of two-component signal transduction system YycFG